MNGKRIFLEAVGIICTLAAGYYGLFQKDMINTGICFIIVGLANISKRTTFTLLLMVGLFCLSLSVNNHLALKTTSIILLVASAAQLTLAPRLIRAWHDAGQDSGKTRILLWENDICVYLINWLKKRGNQKSGQQGDGD